MTLPFIDRRVAVVVSHQPRLVRKDVLQDKHTKKKWVSRQETEEEKPNGNDHTNDMSVNTTNHAYRKEV